MRAKAAQKALRRCGKVHERNGLAVGAAGVSGATRRPQCTTATSDVEIRRTHSVAHSVEKEARFS